MWYIVWLLYATFSLQFITKTRFFPALDALIRASKTGRNPIFSIGDPVSGLPTRRFDRQGDCYDHHEPGLVQAHPLARAHHAPHLHDEGHHRDRRLVRARELQLLPLHGWQAPVPAQRAERDRLPDVPRGRGEDRAELRHPAEGMLALLGAAGAAQHAALAPGGSPAGQGPEEAQRAADGDHQDHRRRDHGLPPVPGQLARPPGEGHGERPRHRRVQRHQHGDDPRHLEGQRRHADRPGVPRWCQEEERHRLPHRQGRQRHHRPQRLLRPEVHAGRAGPEGVAVQRARPRALRPDLRPADEPQVRAVQHHGRRGLERHPTQLSARSNRYIHGGARIS